MELLKKDIDTLVLELNIIHDYFKEQVENQIELERIENDKKDIVKKLKVINNKILNNSLKILELKNDNINLKNDLILYNDLLKTINYNKTKTHEGNILKKLIEKKLI